MAQTLNLNVLALIPARGGSKGIPHKNIAPLAGEPLIAHTLIAARQSQHVSRVVVSTDDEQIAAVAREWGGAVPFMRPDELAQDDTPALPVIQHAIEFLRDVENWTTDIVVYLQPTSPLRRADHIDAAIEKLANEGADTVASVIRVPHNFNPASVMRLEDGELKPYMQKGADILRRQDKPVVYARNGPAVLACTAATIMQGNTLYDPRTLPLMMTPQESVDIDTPFDLKLTEWLMSQ